MDYMDYNITYRQKDGGWQYIISFKNHDGKWKQRSKQGYETKRAARKAAGERLDEMKEKFEIKLVEGHDKITFEQFKKMFLNDRDLHIEGNTTKSYKAAFGKFKKLNTMIMEDIEFAHIQDCVNEMIKEGLKLSSIKIYLGKIKTFFSAAVKPYRIITENPITDDIQLPRPKTKKKDKKVKALTKAQLDELLGKIQPEKDRIICILASNCGLRLGEIIGLCNIDINLKNRVIDVNKQWKIRKDGTWGLDTVKSKNSTRTVPIPINAIEPLKLYLNSNVKNIDRRIFPDRNTDSTSSRLAKKFKKLGFNNSAHDLRHTYASMMLTNGVDPKTLAEFLGDTVETVLATYVHTTGDSIIAATQKLNQIF